MNDISILQCKKKKDICSSIFLSQSNIFCFNLQSKKYANERESTDLSSLVSKDTQSVPYEMFKRNKFIFLFLFRNTLRASFHAFFPLTTRVSSMVPLLPFIVVLVLIILLVGGLLPLRFVLVLCFVLFS